MSLALQTIRYYTAQDPYLFSVDNRPLQDLEARDTQLNTELDKRTTAVNIIGGATTTNVQLPTGWTVTVNGTGDYTITHSLNYTNYVVQATALSTSGGQASVYSMDANTVRVQTRTTAGALAHLQFMLLITNY